MPFILEDSVEDESERKRIKDVLDIINSKNKKKLWVLKRILDIPFAGLALILAFIPMLFIALCIFISDGHNPIYQQERIGRLGKPFKMYKFRTMKPNAEKMLDEVLEHNEMDGPVFKIKEDKRITKIGKFLRKTSLDELPQFINVLKGDMTLIGPRPPLRREVEQYTEYHKIRLLVTPGITCLWQVHPQRNSVSFDDWVDMDIDYVINRNFKMDAEIVFKTVYVMIKGEGQ